MLCYMLFTKTSGNICVYMLRVPQTKSHHHRHIFAITIIIITQHQSECLHAPKWQSSLPLSTEICWKRILASSLFAPNRPFKLLFFRSQNYAENISKYFSTSSSSAWSLDSVDSLVSLVDAARLGRSGPCCFAEVRPKGRNKMLNVLSWFAGIFEA